MSYTDSEITRIVVGILQTPADSWQSYAYTARMVEVLYRAGNEMPDTDRAYYMQLVERRLPCHTKALH